VDKIHVELLELLCIHDRQTHTQARNIIA